MKPTDFGHVSRVYLKYYIAYRSKYKGEGVVNLSILHYLAPGAFPFRPLKLSFDNDWACSMLIQTLSRPLVRFPLRSCRGWSYTSMANPTAPSWKSWRVNPPNAISSTGNTFAHHPELSRLPVPKLEQTAEKLIYSASALATSEHELEELQRKLGDFTKSGGVGERLQGKLKARAEQQQAGLPKQRC